MLTTAAIGTTFATTAATGPLFLGILAAMAAGLVSFASPCVIPLVPGYISYRFVTVWVTRPALS